MRKRRWDGSGYDFQDYAERREFCLPHGGELIMERAQEKPMFKSTTTETPIIPVQVQAAIEFVQSIQCVPKDTPYATSFSATEASTAAFELLRDYFRQRDSESDK